MRAGLARVFLAKKAGKLALVVAVAAAGALAVGALQAAAASAADVLKVRLGGDKAETRIVLDVNRSVSGKLVSDGAGDGKVVVTLSDVEVPMALGGDGQGLVRRWAVEESGRSAKVTVELAQDAVVRRRFLLPPCPASITTMRLRGADALSTATFGVVVAFAIRTAGRSLADFRSIT